MGFSFAVFYLGEINMVFGSGDEVDFVSFGFVIFGEDFVAFSF